MGVKKINLDCTNPNYISVERFTKKVSFVSRAVYLEHGKSNAIFTQYKTRCGKCLACRLYKGYQWSNRLQAESKLWDYTYFLTFTFRDENYDPVYLLQNPMREIQLCLKRLRKKYKGLKLRYYVGSELGGETLRFHYHMILYSPVQLFQDLRHTKKKYYRSAQLEKLWQNGGVIVAYATADTMRYTANYVQDKKNTIQHSFSRNLGNDWIKNNMENNMYVINGKFSAVPKKLKLKTHTDIVDANEILMLEKLKVDVENQQDIKARVIQKNFFRKKL